MQQRALVAGDEAFGRDGDKRMDLGVRLEAGGLGSGRDVPQPDRLVMRARGEPPVRKLL